MTKLNLCVVHVYGLTETYGPITVCPEQEQWNELAPGNRAQLLARQGIQDSRSEDARMLTAPPTRAGYALDSAWHAERDRLDSLTPC